MSELEANHPKCMGAGIYTYEFTTFAITVAIAVAITVAIAATIKYTACCTCQRAVWTLSPP